MHEGLSRFIIIIETSLLTRLCTEKPASQEGSFHNILDYLMEPAIKILQFGFFFFLKFGVFFETIEIILFRFDKRENSPAKNHWAAQPNSVLQPRIQYLQNFQYNQILLFAWLWMLPHEHF